MLTQGLQHNQNLETIQVCIVVLCFPRNTIARIHLYDECMRSNAPSLWHKIFVHFVTSRACSLTDHKISSQYEPNADISEQLLSKLLTILLLTHFLLLLSIDGHPCMVLRLCIIVESFNSQIRNIFPHFSLRDLPCHRTMKILFLDQVSLKLW